LRVKSAVGNRKTGRTNRHTKISEIHGAIIRFVMIKIKLGAQAFCAQKKIRFFKKKSTFFEKHGQKIFFFGKYICAD
jgi:hypothetical protein